MYVELKNINKTYGSYQASRNVDFGIEKGKLIGLLGPSGSGKTNHSPNDRRAGNSGQRRNHY
mgnify:CR=1 FL=1